MNGSVKYRATSGKLLVLGLLLVLVAPTFAAPDEARGTVTRVVDGDTFDVRIAENQDVVTIRLADIDSPEYNRTRPEMSEPGAWEAKNFTEKLLLNKMVYLDIDNKTRTDTWGRWVCVVYLSNPDGSVNTSANFNKMLVDAGHAKVKDYTNKEFDPNTWWSAAHKQGAQPGTSTSSSSVEIIDVNPKEEYVVIQNNGNAPVNMTWWRLEDEKNHSYTFPEFILKAGANVTVHTYGDRKYNTATDLYTGINKDIWNNKGGDTAYLYDSQEKLVCWYSYH